MIKIDIQKRLNGPEGQMELKFQTRMDNHLFASIYGSSGAGKSSVLRMIAGLLKPDRGQIIVDQETWFDSAKKIDLKPQQRNVGLVFQEAALFPNMNIEQNLTFALRKQQDASIVEEMLEILELTELRKRRPNQLSGGQQQRVALARSLIRKPKMLLLDEPLSALDNAMREKMQKYILHFHSSFDLTTILVSHQLSEVLKMSDYIMMMENGIIVNEGKSSNIFPVSDMNADSSIEVDVIEQNDQEITVLVNDKMYRLQITNDIVIADGKVRLPVKSF